MITGYVLGGLVTGVALLVATIDVCIPSIIYRTLLGFPPKTKVGSPEASRV